MRDFTDPLALFRQAVDALNTEDWAAAAALIDPVSLRTFARQLLERLAPAVPHRTVTADEYMRSDPQLPREIAEYYAAEARRHADSASRLQQELPEVGSAEALRALTPDEVFRHWLDGRSMRRQIERLAADGRISRRAADRRTMAGFTSYHYVPLGVVADGDRIAHILYRHDVDPDQPWSGDLANWLASQPADEQVLARELWACGHPSTAMVRRQGDGTWRFVVDHDFLNVGSTHITGVRLQDEDAESASDSSAR
jgi:hypothetical protein